MSTGDPTARPGGPVYSELKTVIEIIVTAPVFAKQVIANKALCEPQSNPVK